jgi:hypothetical protein
MRLDPHEGGDVYLTTLPPGGKIPWLVADELIDRHGPYGADWSGSGELRLPGRASGAAAVAMLREAGHYVETTTEDGRAGSTQCQPSECQTCGAPYRRGITVGVDDVCSADPRGYQPHTLVLVPSHVCDAECRRRGVDPPRAGVVAGQTDGT